VMPPPSGMSPPMPMSFFIVSADKDTCFPRISLPWVDKKHCNYDKNRQEKFVHFSLHTRGGFRIHTGL
jgi:hypothetical protein